MRIALLDENDKRIDSIEQMIVAHDSEWKVKKYTTPFAFVTGISDELKGDVDAMLIHIPPNKMDYIQMARDVQAYFRHIQIVFYSEINELAEQIFVARPTFFMKLPFSNQLFREAMERVAMDYKLDEGQTLTIRVKGSIQKIPFQRITYIESVGRKMKIYTVDCSFEVYMKIDELKCLLPQQFKQCHRSFIINSDKISAINMDGIILDGDHYIPMSRTYHKMIMQLIV